MDEADDHIQDGWNRKLTAESH